MFRAVFSNDKRASPRPATAAVAMTTRKRAAAAESRDLPDDVTQWTSQDVQRWLGMNDLGKLRDKYADIDIDTLVACLPST